MKRSLAAAVAGMITVTGMVAMPTVRMHKTSAAFSDIATTDSLDLTAGEVTLTYDGTPLGSVELGIGKIGPGFNRVYEFGVHNDSTVQNPTDQTEFRLYTAGYDTTGATGPALAGDLEVSIERKINAGSWELLFDGAFADLEVPAAGWGTAFGVGGTAVGATGKHGALVTNDNKATTNSDEGGTAFYRLSVTYPYESNNDGANGAVEVSFVVEGRNSTKQPMLLTVTTSGANQAATLPLYGTVDADIDWNTAGADPANCTGKVSTAGQVSCTYPAAGTYTIAVTGTVGQFGNGISTYTNANRITGVTQWGTLGTTSLAGAFRDTSNLTTLPADLPSTVTNTSYMFNSSAFNGPIASWDVSQVTNMRGMFYDSINFNQDIGTWNVSKVADMGTMFYGARKFNRDLSGWDTGTVTDMGYMFWDARVFNQDLSGWCVPAFKTAPTGFSGGLGVFTAAKPVWGTCPGADAALYLTGAGSTLPGTLASTNTSGNESKVITRDSGTLATQATTANYHAWSYTAPAGGLVLSGTARLLLYTGFSSHQITAGLYDCVAGAAAATITGCTLLASTSRASGDVGTFGRVINFGAVTATVAQGRELRIKIINPSDTSANDYTARWGGSTYPSVLYVK